MKEGVIEQLDTPANIILNPATEYVRKFTEDVPREKVLTIEYVMDPIDGSANLGDIMVHKDSVIESVAEMILLQENPVAVWNDENNVVGTVHPSKLINVLFSKNSRKSVNT
jgi:glycine betaine/proline transport system ATP-binding protein